MCRQQAMHCKTDDQRESTVDNEIGVQVSLTYKIDRSCGMVHQEKQPEEGVVEVGVVGDVQVIDAAHVGCEGRLELLPRHVHDLVGYVLLQHTAHTSKA